ASIGELVEADIKLGLVTVAGERDIGQMPVEGAGGEHLDAVDGRALRLVDRSGIAVVDIGVEALFDRDLPALVTLTNLGDDTAGSSLDHLCQHSVLDAVRSLVPEKHDLVADGEASVSVLGSELIAFFDGPAFNQFLAGAYVELAHVDPAMRDDQCGPRRIEIIFPIVDQCGD